MLTFQDLYESYSSDVYRFSLWLAGNSSEAEDITAETFVRAWVRDTPIRTETLKAFLFTIARNVYLGRLRKRKREVALEGEHINPLPGPEQLVETRLELQNVQRFLQTLPEIDRTAFVLRVQHELPYAEIARVLRLSLTATKVKVHRVRKRILAMSLDKEVSG
jgi:RNA polymerase sigma-70 factor (ECF subfamily)